MNKNWKVNSDFFRGHLTAGALMQSCWESVIVLGAALSRTSEAIILPGNSRQVILDAIADC